MPPLRVWQRIYREHSIGNQEPFHCIHPSTLSKPLLWTMDYVSPDRQVLDLLGAAENSLAWEGPPMVLSLPIPNSAFC